MSSSQTGGSVGASSASHVDAPSATAAPPDPDASSEHTAQIPSTVDSTASAATTVKWADEAGEAAAGATQKVAAGANKLVGWTVDLDTVTHSRGLRPMHVRVSVRVHHVAFLHPGLDSGGRVTIGDKGRKWRKFSKKARKVTPPGLLQFGNKQGSWKNPMSTKTPKGKLFSISEEGGNALTNTAKLRKDIDNEDAKDASEISEIISAEAFRLSRDGIIQHHYALNHAAHQKPPPPERRSSVTSDTPRSGNKTPSAPQNNPHSSMLSPYSAANPEEAARYYKECAQRPKGYRRLVVSSAVPTHDVPIPPPPSASTRKVAASYASSRPQSSGDLGSRRMPNYKPPVNAAMSRSEKMQTRRGSTSTWSFEKDPTADGGEKEKTKGDAKDAKDENLFDNVEYRYIGPPQTGPEFFQLLRSHGAATFGRYLPELACSVPNHSVGFELRKSKSKKHCASTQPFVIEAPHVIWGDARDKMLSKIAQEGCPLIDSRSFEYVSNADLDETELSESLMICGATLWVKNANDDDTSVSSMSTLKPHYTKGMVKAEYYGGKMIDGIKGGLGMGVKGLAKGTKETVNAAEKGTKGLVKGTKEAAQAIEKGTKEKLLPIPQESELESTPISSTHSEGRRTRKRDKLKSMFNPKKVTNKLRRRSRQESEDGRSVDGSLASVGNDDVSIASESIAADSAHATDTADRETRDEDFEVMESEGEAAKKTPEDVPEEEFTVVKPVPYNLLLDDIIDIRIVSFPDKNDVIANFPISVASVMVQRNMEDRINDPLKPSELTATFIQEPSAPLLRWGVELKVTLRAVEVKPQVPRVMPRPKDVIDDEVEKMKDRLSLLGKTPEEAKKALDAKEDEIAKEERALNDAIVAYGYGRGEDGGAGLEEVRLRQMFYCDREHDAIHRKVKRRTEITEDEKQLLNDARLDPSNKGRHDQSQKSEQELLEMLDIAFPGIEDDPATAGEDPESTKEGVVAGAKSDAIEISDSLAKASLSLAKSLDACLADLTDKPAVPEVKKRLYHTFTQGTRPNVVTKSIARQWCTQVSKRLSTEVSNMNATDASVKASIAKLQNIIAECVPGSDMADVDGANALDEETKLDEDEIALSQTNEVDSSKVMDWATSVIVELEACAADLEDDEESLTHSETFDSLGQVEGDKSVSSAGTGNDPPGTHISGASLSRQSSAMSTRASDADEALWEKVLSQKGRPSDLSNSSVRIRNSISISTVKNALPRSETTPRSQINELMQMAKSSGRSHQVTMRTSSLSATMLYLSIVMVVFALGAFAAFMLFQEAWSKMLGTT